MEKVVDRLCDTICSLSNNAISSIIDRGAQFVSRDFHAMMEDWAIKHSMSRPRTPIDSRFIETFWKTMKVELVKKDLLNEQT